MKNSSLLVIKTLLILTDMEISQQICQATQLANTQQVSITKQTAAASGL